MAAIAYPTPHPRQVVVRPRLRVVRAPSRPTDAVFRRRRIGAALFLGAVLITAAVLAAGFLTRPDTGASIAIRTEPAPGAVVGDLAAYGSAHLDPQPGSVYVVQPGDTLWSIARALVPAGDVRGEVDKLETLNGSAALQAGQRLVLAPSPGS
jgi:hypothetical protein